MFNLGDRIQHQDTGNIGIVVGYGKRIVNNQCLETVKVKLVSPASSNKKTVQDLKTKWFSCLEEHRTLHSYLITRHLMIKPVKRYDFVPSA